MVQMIEAHKRHFEDLNWLKAHWLFSFASYNDPRNEGFGRLVVFNDDVVMPGESIRMHSHEDLDIITIMLHGEITHEDDIGNRTLLKAGFSQRLFAGTGVRHAERNLGAEPAHFYQIWLTPQAKGVVPSYSHNRFFKEDWKNSLMPIASGRGHEGALRLSSDTVIHQCCLDSGRGIVFEPGPKRKVFVYITFGDVVINGRRFSGGDQARIQSEERIDLRSESLKGAEFVLIDLQD